MKNWKRNLQVCFVTAFSMISTGCQAQNELVTGMESAEQGANERARYELVAYMSLETMFPDPRVRQLAAAAGDGDIGEIEALVKKGADVNTRGKRNATPLFWALRSSNLEGFTKLLMLGADPNVVFEDGGSILYWAIQHEDPEFLNVALKFGANPNLKSGRDNETPIFYAIGEQRNKLDALIAAGANVNAQDRYGLTPAMLAAGRGSFDVVYKLLVHGADYHLKTSTGHTLADITADMRGRMDPNHEMYDWMQKVIGWLEARGVDVPEHG